MKYVDEGATLKVELYRGNGAVLVGSWAGLPKPPFAGWKAALGAWTGASTGLFEVFDVAYRP